jgi:putative toxin-antitoxin system antitoxin component (TIGR02293 family)
MMAKKNQEVNESAMAPYFTRKISGRSILDLALGWIDEPLNRVDTFRNGIDKNAFENLKELSGLDYGTLADALGVSTKTLQRKTVFDTIQSEKIYELADLYATGVNYFGQEGFRRWMDRPLFSIGNRKPLELIDVSAGIALLKNEIMRLQHGIAV